MLRINTNYAASFASMAVSNSSKALDGAMEKLSSGLRINFAKDDAAGQAIATRLNAEIMGLNRATKNAADLRNGVAVGDSALKEVAGLLLRSRELSVAAATATFSASDRVSMNAEFYQMVEQITVIGETTEVAGIKLFEDKFVSFQIGANSGDTFIVESRSFSTAGLSQSGFLMGDILTIASAQQNILSMDAALATVNTFRSNLASTANRMEHVISNLDQIRLNLNTSRGRIIDTDYAKETTELAKNQILQQVGIAMIAQANTSKASLRVLLGN